MCPGTQALYLSPRGVLMANAPYKKPADLIQGAQNDAVKEYIVYDGSGRMFQHYVAPADADDGAPCILTQYAYVTTSTNVQYRKEMISTWQKAWEQF